MKEPTTERTPAAVEGKGASPAFPKQAGEAWNPKNWVERSVWTERMLERLAKSQEQTVWYSLWDKVWDQDNLDQAILKVISWFAEQGLFSLKTAQAQWLQSLTGNH